MDQIFYLCSFTRDEKFDILSEEEAINELEYYEYILKVKVVSINSLEILDIIYLSPEFKNYDFLSISFDVNNNVMYKKIINIHDNIKFLINFNLDNFEEILKQIQNYNNFVYINSFTKQYLNNYIFEGYKLFNETKVICLKSLRNIQENFIKNNKILQE